MNIYTWIYIYLYIYLYIYMFLCVYMLFSRYCTANGWCAQVEPAGQKVFFPLLRLGCSECLDKFEKYISTLEVCRLQVECGREPDKKLLYSRLNGLVARPLQLTPTANDVVLNPAVRFDGVDHLVSQADEPKICRFEGCKRRSRYHYRKCRSHLCVDRKMDFFFRDFRELKLCIKNVVFG